MLTIAQITDPHITSDKDPLNKKRNAERLGKVLEAIHQRQPRPVAIFASGDLVDLGEPEEYAELQAIVRDIEIPLYLGLGNHDRRGPFRAAFPATPVDESGFVQYAVDFEGLRIIMCDTLEEGKNGGGFCKHRASWLRRIRDEAPHTPTILILHHPPIPSGIQWMDESPEEAWIVRLAETIRDWKGLRTLTCGHVHRTYHGAFAGHLVSVSPATSIQLALDLKSVNMRVPDGRELLVEEPPGYTLFMWDKGALTTHICLAGDFAPAVTYRVPFVAD